MTRVCTVYSVYLIMLDDRTGFIESELSDTTTPLLRKCSKVRAAKRRPGPRATSGRTGPHL